MDQLISTSATRLTKLIRSGEISPVAVVNAYLAQLEKLNPQLNAIVTIAPDVRSKAEQAEQAVTRGDRLGVLHGLPITIKDTIETAGLRSTSGSRLRSKYVPQDDAPAVARLKAAGAIILGKTNAAEMAMEYTADNPVFGRTNNPYDISLSPGGSSGGEAAAIASGMSAAGLGSDLAGSIRIPAHFCGIAGLKPTAASVPGYGQCPPSIGPYSLAAAIGPMARYVADLELLFGVLSDRPVTATDLGGFRVAWFTDDGVAPTTSETAAAVRAAVDALASAGLDVEEIRPPGVGHGNELWLKLFSRASVMQLRSIYKGHEEEGGPFVKWRLASADERGVQTLDDYIDAWMERDRLRHNLLAWMNDFPLIVAPVGSTNAVPHDTVKIEIEGQTINAFKAFSYSQTLNVFDLPAVTVRAGQSANGMPMGVQIIGRPFAELEVLSAAAIVEKTLGGWQPPPAT